jgi:DNA repair exonuclease SbcCD ATPase subunit
MKIHSLSVKNFKIHREFRLDFDARVTLLAGANETGKSTLLEALNKAFFLRSRGNSEDHKNIRSLLHAGHPEVEVVFEADGSDWTLQKCFSGVNGTTRLQQINGSTFIGDAAEDRIAELLQVGGARKLESQWSHLLIKQRCSGMDPALDARAQSEKLVRLLQTQGGAAVLLSPRDQAVASHFDHLAGLSFNQNGSPKAGSSLAQAVEAESAASARLSLAADLHAKLMSAAQDFATADASIVAKTKELEGLESRLVETQKKLAEAQQIENDLKTLALQAQNHAAELQRLEDAEKRILEAGNTLKVSEAGLAPHQGELLSAENALTHATQALTAAEATYSAAANNESSALKYRDLAEASRLVFEKNRSAEDLAKSVAVIGGLRSRIEELEQKICAQPEIDDSAFARLNKLENAVAKARATLEATATKVRVVSSQMPVTIGDRIIAAGEDVILTSETALKVGDAAHLSLTPGGAGTLQQAKDKLELAESEFQAALRSLSVAGLREAQNAITIRATLSTQLQGLRESLQASNADRIDEDLRVAKQDLTQAEAALAALIELNPDFQKPVTPSLAIELLASADKKFSLARDEKSTAEAARTAARDAQSAARTRLDNCKNALAKAAQKVATHTGHLETLLEQFGDGQTRATLLAAALEQKTNSCMALDLAEKQLQALQIDQLRRSSERLQASISSGSQTLAEARTRKAVALSQLHRDGMQDPESDLKRARILHEAAAKSLEGVRRKAEAQQLLRRLFQDHKSALAKEYTRPLVEKINTYLECLFGPRVNATLGLSGDQFQEIRVSRAEFGGVNFHFDQLSGGAAEQVAAAARLAMAQILAQDHGGALPVVFDDAFTNTDPDRTAKLLDMLYLAAENGLQVIVFSCNPADYSGSGAKEITMERPALSSTLRLDTQEPPEMEHATSVELSS